MRLRQLFFRTTFFVFLLICILTGLTGVVRVPVVSAASSNIVISQIYGGGGNSGATYTNDYVELFNLGPTTVSLTGWSIQYIASTSTGTWSVTNLNGSILPGQYYLVQLAGGSNGSALPTPDATGSMNLNATDGKVALVKNTTALTGSGCPFSVNVIDLIGYGSANCSETANAPSPSNTTADIRTNVCTDTDNNSLDFFNDTPNPRNSSAFPIACIKVLNITSSIPNGTYTVGTTVDTVIDIDVEFSVPVNVTGEPYLLLETGAVDNKAIYVPSSDGDNILTFKYVVVSGDVSSDLDYVSNASLVLNGGTITGAAGDAVLTLPDPGSAGSLGANKDIKIDNQQSPSVTINQAIGQIDPTGALPISFTVVFSEPINAGTFTDADVAQNGTATGITWNISNSGDGMTFTLSATAAIGTGTIIPSIAANQITDTFGNGNLASTSADNNVTYIVTPLTVTVEQASGQLDPTGNIPANFMILFSAPIVPSTFTVSDITQNGTATGVVWKIVNADAGGNKTFTLSAVSVSSPGVTTLRPSIAAGQVTDTAGNNNLLSTSVDNTVTFDNTISPSVTINQSIGQSDPTASFPINFTVVFSEPIIASIFTPSDISQTGTATGVTWSIANSGDNMNFSVAATSATGVGNIKPFIAANRVTDLVGNNNVASTSTDNTVIYETTRPTVTVNQATGQVDPTGVLPINFTVTFSEPINVSTFAVDDITQAGTATGISWVITDSGDQTKFTLSAIALTKNGTLIPAIGINKVTDIAGNWNFPSTSIDNVVTSTILLPTPTRTPLPTPTSMPTLGVTISEVAWMGTSASSSDEWVELYNSSSSVVDLSNWSLKSTDGSINITFLNTDSDHTMNPGEYFILARAGSFTDVVINKEITTAFNDSGKSLELRNNLGVLVDTVNSNGGGWPAGKGSPTYASMERHSITSLDADSNWYTFAGTSTSHDRNGGLVKGTPGYANWAFTVTATPLPPATPTRTPVGGSSSRTTTHPPLLAINEFVPRPGHDWNNDGFINTGDEYIEIINHGVIDVNLSGYKLDDEANIGSSPYSLKSEVLKPGERRVFYGSETGILLGDGGDGVRLYKPNGQLMDAYNYSVVEFPDQSYCRLPDDGGADDWNTNCYPTPGLQNSLSGVLLRPPTLNTEDETLCPIADTLPYGFVLAECTPFGNNIWSRFYWDQFGWYGERVIQNINSKWNVIVD